MSGTFVNDYRVTFQEYKAVYVPFKYKFNNVSQDLKNHDLKIQ